MIFGSSYFGGNQYGSEIIDDDIGRIYFDAIKPTGDDPRKTAQYFGGSAFGGDFGGQAADTVIANIAPTGDFADDSLIGNGATTCIATPKDGDTVLSWDYRGNGTDIIRRNDAYITTAAQKVEKYTASGIEATGWEIRNNHSGTITDLVCVPVAEGLKRWLGFKTTVTQDSTEQYVGDYSMKVEPDSGEKPIAFFDTEYEVGKTYTAQARIKATAGTKAYFSARSIASSGTLVMDGSWQLLTWTFTPTVADSSLEIKLNTIGATMHVDAVALYESDQVDDFDVVGLYDISSKVATVNETEVGEPSLRRDLEQIFIDPIADGLQIGELTIFNNDTYLQMDSISVSGSVGNPQLVGELAANDTAPTYDFYAKSVQGLRNVAGGVFISFDRAYDANASFFTFGTSRFDGGDVFKGNGSVTQEWDKFGYKNYSEYLNGFEYTYEQNILGSLILGYADVSLNNIADTFSPYGDSALAQDVAPNRPIKLFSGFDTDIIQVFVGQTTDIPKTDDTTAVFHAADFIASFADQELRNGKIYLSQRTDQIIADVLENEAGLSPTQFDLDTGLNTIDFAHAPAGTKIGSFFRELIDAEQGRLYQDYDGEIFFKNRDNKKRQTAITLKPQHVYSEAQPDSANVINRVKINSDVREVQASQQVHPVLKDGSTSQYEDFSSFKVEANSSVDKFFNFDDPTTSITTPTKGSGVEANSASDGSGTSKNSVLGFSVLETFTESVLCRFSNSSGSDIHVTEVTINGTPAKVVEEIRVDISDVDSETRYGEKLLELDNDFFNDKDYAETVANNTLTAVSAAPNTRELVIKSIPYLAVGDVISYNSSDFVVDFLQGKLYPGNGSTQTIRIRPVV